VIGEDTVRNDAGRLCHIGKCKMYGKTATAQTNTKYPTTKVRFEIYLITVKEHVSRGLCNYILQ